MSEEKSPPDEKSPSNEKSPPAKKKRRTWPQRIQLTILVLLILACASPIALNIMLPVVIRRVANAYDLDCEYGRMDMSLIGGNAHIWDLVLRPKTGGESIVQADYVQGNISPLALLRGRLVAYRAEVDGVKIVIDREADGSIPLLKELLPKSSTAPAAPPKNVQPKPLSLQAPLRVDAVRISHVDTVFRDHSVTPTFETTIKTSVRISDVGSQQLPTQFELDVEMDPLLDTLHVEGEAHNTADSLTADVQVLLRGLHLKPAACYLTPLGIKPVAESTTVRAHMTLAANVIANSQDISAQLALDQIKAATDEREFASLERLTLSAPRITTSGAKLGQLLIENGHLSAQRTPEGTIRIAGIELVPTTPTTQPAPTSPPMPQPTVAAAPTAHPFNVSLDEIHLKNLQATFDDSAIKPEANLVAQLNDLSIKGITTDPAAKDSPIAIVGAFSLPGLIQAIHLDGSATPFAATKHVALQVQGQGVKPDVIKPYLDQLGIESQIQNASLAAKLDASASIDPAGVLSASANVAGVRFDDGKVPLLGFNSAKIGNVTLNPKTGAIGIGNVELSGPTLEIHRDHQGQLAAVGFRIVPPPARSPSAQAPIAVGTATPATAPAAQPFVLPRIEIGHLKWSDVHLALRDDTVSPPTNVMLGDAGVEVNNLVVDLNSTTTDHKPGSFRAWLNAPHVVDSLMVDGALSCAPHQFVVDMSVIGYGISGDTVAPYLKNLGVVPVIKSGSLTLKTKATVSQTDNGLSAALDLADLKYNDGDTELAGVDAMHLAGLQLQSNSISVHQLTVTRPRAVIARNPDGTLEAGGVRLVPVPSTQPVAITLPNDAPPPTLHLAALPIKIALKNFQLESGSLGWSDRAVTPAVQTRITASVTLANAQIGGATAPADLHVDAKVDGSVDRAIIDGKVNLSPESPAAQLNIVADGVRVGPLATYLPPNIRATMKDGHFAANLDLGASNNTAGGIAAHLVATNLSLAEGADKTNLASLSSFKLIAPRIDPAGGAIAVSEISSVGVAAEVRKTPDGAIEALGIQIIPAAAVPPPQPATSQTPGTAADAVAANIAPPSSQPTTAPVLNTATLVANARRPLPLVTIDKLDLNVQQLRLDGMTEPKAAPIALTDFQVKNLAPISLGGPDAESRPPAKLQIAGGIYPIVSTFGVAIEAAPLAVEPSIKIDLTASGIKGDGLTKLLPSLQPTLDGSKLTDGTFHTHLDASISYGRRGPRDIDLSRGFTTTFDVKPVEFRATADGPVIGGLDEIRGDGIKVVPATGDVQIQSIEVTKPIGRFSRETDGIHAFGFILPIAQPTGTEPAPTTQQAIPAAAVISATQPAEKPSMPLVRPANEIRLDQFTVSDIDVIITDNTTTPPTLIPLKSLDVEVDDLSNQMPWTGKPVRFSMLCTSDKVPMPPRKGSEVQVIASTQPSDFGSYIEMRELFSQVTAAGRIGMTQKGDMLLLNGWAKTSVNGFELLGIRGIAKQYGVIIGGGVFDDSNDFSFQQNGIIETRNKLVFTNLSLSEPANGPLKTAFKLPVPIDAAIGAVTDPDGSITMDLPVPIKSGAVSTGDVIGPAIDAIGGVLVTGIASAPIKAASGITSLIGLGGKHAKPQPPVEIHFLPGYTELDQASLAALDQLAAKVRKDKNLTLQLHHDLTAADVARASIRANPSPQDCLILAERLRQRKAELLDRRAELSAQAKGQIGSESPAQAATTLDMLRDVDQQIAHADDSLDQLYDMLRPGAENQVDRRTRAASLDIGHQRLLTIQAALTQALGTDSSTRVNLTNPQFDPVQSTNGGDVVITLITKKH